MITFNAVYSHTVYKDEETGYTGFYVTSTDRRIYGEVYCVGKIPFYEVGTPLVIIGEQQKNRIRVKETKLASFSFPSELLSSIKGIGDKKVEKIEEIINGEDIFAFVNRMDAKEKLTPIGEKEALKVIEKIKSLESQQNLLELIFSVNGYYDTVNSFFKKYGKESFKKIEENPYMLIDYGLSFDKCELLGNKYNMDTLDDKRICALIKAIFNLSAAAGHCYLDIETFILFKKRLDKKNTENFFVFGFLLKEKKKYTIEEKEGKIRIYRIADFMLEEKAAKNIKRLIKKKISLPIKDLNIKEIEKECGISFDKEQQSAFELLESTGVKMLTGGPGTGKTATMRGIVTAFRQLVPNATVSLCAPTANAAKRLRQSTDENALTVHKLLNVRPFGGEYDYIKNLASDLVIVDEASMIDIELLGILTDAIKDGALLLFVGDEDQLPSVGQGNVFHDLLVCKSIDKVRLKTIHRQDKNCSIVDNSIRIRKGDTDLYQDNMTQIIVADDLQKTSLEVIEKYYDINNPWKTKVYTPVRNENYDISTRVMNRLLHAAFNHNAKMIRGGKIFAEGDPVIMTRNNYADGYCNGDEGIIKKAADNVLTIEIDGNELNITGQDLNDVELAYALTTHKAQGSECETAIIIVPQRPQSMLTRNLVYVAATRAKKKNIFITEGDALAKAIRYERKKIRLTSLAGRIEN